MSVLDWLFSIMRQVDKFILVPVQEWERMKKRQSETLDRAPVQNLQPPIETSLPAQTGEGARQSMQSSAGVNKETLISVTPSSQQTLQRKRAAKATVPWISLHKRRAVK